MWQNVIEMHVARARTGEFKLFDKVSRFFLGDAWTDTSQGASEAELIKTSTNFVFPVVETATSVLIPPNPQVSANPRNPLSTDQVAGIEGVVNLSLDAGQYRSELAVVVQNVVMYGRGPVKTTWDEATDLPVTKFIDPRCYFFDQTAQRHADVRYEIEATLLSKGDMERKVASGYYPKLALERQSAERYPQWLLPDGKLEIDSLKNYQPWYLVWEVHDRESGRVKHFLPGERDPILDDELVFRPYDLLTFNYNGKNCGGISEIGLILPNQEEYNWTETFLLNILRFGIPGTFYDADILSTDQAVKVVTAPLGAYIPLKVPSSLKKEGMASAFMSRPMPVYPMGANEMLEKKRAGMAHVSALSDAQRGQTVGAKTATELAFIEGNTKNRLRPRQSKVDELTERVAEKHGFLASKYMRKEKVQQIVGSQDWATFSPWTIADVSTAFKMVAYSPMESNKAVRIETLRNIQPLIVGNPWVNQRKMTEQMFKLMEMDGLVYSEAEMQAQLAAQTPPGAPAVVPPANAPLPGVDGGPTLPPRAQGFADAVSTAPPESV